MASEQTAASKPFELGDSVLRPDEVTTEGLPLAMRGYERESVDRLVKRVADAYATTLRKNQSQRELIRSLEADLDGAQAEAAASARSVAELMQASARTAGGEGPTSAELRELETRLEGAERERDTAIADLRVATERADALAGQMKSLESDRRVREGTTVGADSTDGEAARLLLAAVRAAEDVRSASRARALRTLTKARELAALVEAQAERERTALAETQARRTRAEQEAEERRAEARRVDAEIEERRRQLEHEEEGLAQARAEADHVVLESEEERRRLRELLAGALASLDTEVSAPSDSLVDDLSTRLHETAEPAGGEPD